MVNGIIAEVSELIALQRYTEKVSYPPSQKALQTGVNLSKVRGRGMDFAEVRNYQAGDEIRHMEWRVTARTGKPHIKLYEEERERPVVLLVDFSPSMFFGTRVALKSVIAARLASLIAWTVIRQNDRIGGLLFSATTHNEYLPRLRKAGVLPFLAGLSQFTHEINRLKNNQPVNNLLSHALQRLRRVVKPGSLLVIISDFYTFDTESEHHLSRLRQLHDILFYHVVDPLELSAPKPGAYAICNGKDSLLLNTGIKGVKNAYQSYCQSRIQSIKNRCKHFNIQYTQVSALADLPLLVRQSFPRSKHG